MAKQSAGLLLYRQNEHGIEVFLVHPGGPFWQNRDAGAWSIPKGEFADDEDPLTAAKREFQEETGMTIDGQFAPLRPIKQRGGKTVYAWLVEGDAEAENVTSNTFSLEWPRGSGKFQEFPEIDRAAWFTFESAGEKILESQLPLLEQAQTLLANGSDRC